MSGLGCMDVFGADGMVRPDLLRARTRFYVGVDTGQAQSVRALHRRLSVLIGVRDGQRPYYHRHTFRYHIAFYLPKAPGEMVVAEALDFPGAVSQGGDLADARLMIASALEELAQLLLKEGSPLPQPFKEAHRPEADLIELMPVSTFAGTPSR